MLRPTPSAVDDIAAGCAALLGGEHAERLLAEGRIPPPWAWINLLAHGTEEQLAVAAIPTRGRGRGRWFVARTFLCREVLDIAGAVGSLPDLQREVLVPLELELMSAPPGDIRHSGTLVQIVSDALERYHRTVLIRARRMGR